jgi:hypothetical protein
MRRLGAKAYRFSVSWTRVLPEGTGTQNPKGFDFCRRLFDELGKAGLQPMCTLFHWDFPQALYRRGGWLNRGAASSCADYAALVADKLGDRVKHWLPLNEPQTFVGMGDRDGVHAPGDKLNAPQYRLSLTRPWVPEPRGYRRCPRTASPTGRSATRWKRRGKRARTGSASLFASARTWSRSCSRSIRREIEPQVEPTLEKDPVPDTKRELEQCGGERRGAPELTKSSVQQNKQHTKKSALHCQGTLN